MKNILTELLQYNATIYAIEDTALMYFNTSNIDYDKSATFLIVGIEYHKLLTLIGSYQYEKNNDYTLIISLTDSVKLTLKVPTIRVIDDYYYDSKYSIHIYLSNIFLNIHYITYQLCYRDANIVICENDNSFPVPSKIDLIGNDSSLTLIKLIQLMIDYQLPCSDKLITHLDYHALSKIDILELYGALFKVAELSNVDIKVQIIKLLSHHSIINSEYLDSAINIVQHITDGRDLLYLICYIFVDDNNNSDDVTNVSAHLFELLKSDPRFYNRALALSYLDIDDKSSIIDAVHIDSDIINSKLVGLMLGDDFQQKILNKKIPLSLDDLNITYSEIVKLDIDISDVNKYVTDVLKLIILDKLENTNENLSSYFKKIKPKRHRSRKGTPFEFNEVSNNHRSRYRGKYRDFDYEDTPHFDNFEPIN